jgi:Flp pilus assembly pilin Flp
MKRSESGQSMVEYALGIGCVSALCMVALGSLGHMSAEMIHEVGEAINYGGSKPGHAGQMVDIAATPWVIN